jgi:Flp pilus assembly protein TadG
MNWCPKRTTTGCRTAWDRILAFKREESGAAMVETAIIMPLAVVLFVGIAEFGRALWAHHQADKAVRVAARYLARLPDTAAVTGWGLTRAQDLALKGDLDGDGSPLVAQWSTTGNFTLSSAGSTPDVVRVSAVVTYSVPLLVAIGLPSSVTYTVNCEQPFIGE